MSSMVNLGMFTNEGSNIISTFVKRTLWKLGSAETSYPQIGLSTNQRNFTPKRIETVKRYVFCCKFSSQISVHNPAKEE